MIDIIQFKKNICTILELDKTNLELHSFHFNNNIELKFNEAKYKNLIHSLSINYYEKYDSNYKVEQSENMKNNIEYIQEVFQTPTNKVNYVFKNKNRLLKKIRRKNYFKNLKREFVSFETLSFDGRNTSLETTSNNKKYQTSHNFTVKEHYSKELSTFPFYQEFTNANYKASFIACYQCLLIKAIFMTVFPKISSKSIVELFIYIYKEHTYLLNGFRYFSISGINRSVFQYVDSVNFIFKMMELCVVNEDNNIEEHSYDLFNLNLKR